jgi:hypothetical protein
MSQPGRGSQFRLTPVPRYSTTTPGGTHVSCAGCCLPVPMGCLATVLALALSAVMAVVRRRPGRQK